MTHPLVVVANRLPVDQTHEPDGTISWRRSPGGLVSAMEPVMQGADGAWIGWPGAAGAALEPFDAAGMHLVPVPLSEQEVAEYYEGFANDTLWPLSHDVISPPEYHRHWWETYRVVNLRFAEAAAAEADTNGLVWVHDYHLQLVPTMLRELRPDVRIGYFHHIPFPPLELFAQLPWRKQVIEGLLGADLLGFQRSSDAANFLRVVRRWTDLPVRSGAVTITTDGTERRVRAGSFPISIDSRRFDAMARDPQVRARAAEVRADLGDPEVLLLGVDRLDYTKGIRHRVKAVGEMFDDGRLEVGRATLVQVASPSRENVEAYQHLREEVELLVGRINGDVGQIGSAPIQYLHQSFGPEEMAALYLAADVMLVTSLRDGMNLVAKEFVAACTDDRGVLVLSEFTGAADELGGALLINPHDVDGIKDAIERAVSMSQRESRSRMRRLRRRVLHDDVARWSQRFLTALREIEPRSPVVASSDEPLDTALARLATDADNGEELLIALDFDGVLSPLVDVPSAARATPRGVEALQRLSVIEHVHLALISGRGLQDLSEVAEVPPGTFLVGSHGAEPGHWDGALHNDPVELDETQRDLYLKLGDELEAAIAGTTARIELKPTTVVLHTRGATPEDTDRLTEAAVRLGEQDGVDAMRGRDVVELSVLSVTKGDALTALRAQTHAHRVLFAGDDVTDERAMRTLASGDVGIRVGDGYTVAAHRVADPEAMADVLHRLADFLERD